MAKKPELPPEENLADVIRGISKSMDRLTKSGLNRRAIIALIADDTKIGKGNIEAVVTSLVNLEKRYTVTT